MMHLVCPCNSGETDNSGITGHIRSGNKARIGSIELWAISHCRNKSPTAGISARFLSTWRVPSRRSAPASQPRLRLGNPRIFRGSTGNEPARVGKAETLRFPQTIAFQCKIWLYWM